VLDTGGGLGSAVGVVGRGAGGELVGAALELFGAEVDVVGAGRALVEVELDGAVAVGRGRAVRVVDEVVGSAGVEAVAEPGAASGTAAAVPAGDCLAATPGAVYTRVLRRPGVAVALACCACRAASRAVSTCWVSWAAAATATPVAATADTVTSPVVTPSLRTARSRAWGVHLPLALPLAARITPASSPPGR